MNKNFLLNLKAAPIVLVIVLGLVGCSNAGFDQTKNGLMYKIHTHGNTKKAKIGDYVEMEFVVKTDKDSVLSSTYKAKKPVKFMVQKSRSVADLMDIIQLLSENDSATVKIPSDSIFDARKGMMRPPFIKPKSLMVFELKIDKVMDQKEFQAEMDKDRAKADVEKNKLKGAELPAIAKYLSDNHLKPDSTKSGVMYVIQTQGTGPVPAKGDTVLVNYVGRLLSGKVFDTNDTTVAKANKLFDVNRKMQGGYGAFKYPVGEHQVIDGWDDFFLTAKKGTKATIIIPSRLAYRDMEKGNVIPAYSTLVFTVELLDVKKGKPAPKMPAMHSMPPQPPLAPQAIKKSK